MNQFHPTENLDKPGAVTRVGIIATVLSATVFDAQWSLESVY
ncbi:hypothetical protein GGGNBK_12705 [Sporosarcina sp. ANT_H38]